jgi:lipopolysaccharide transport protein LptA
MRRPELALLLLLAALPAVAQKDPLRSLRPDGPVTIKADRAEWEKGDAMVYSGKVRLDSADLQLAGDRLELKQFGNGQFEARITGNPATLDHAGVRGESGALSEPVSARASTLVYDSRSETVEVVGEAQLTRGAGNKITGQNIRYDVARRRIQAEGGDNGQVTITIDPPKRDTPAAPEGAAVPEATPAPTAPAAPAAAP